MMSFKRLGEIALYGFGEYPRVDIDSEAAVALQRANITEFKRRWRNWLLGLAGAVSAFIWPLAMNHWIGPNWDKTHAGYYVSLFFFSVIVTIICGFKYKCPHCGAVPQGVLFSASEGTVTYGGGLHPFPIRCRKCGYYLAERALLRDLKAGGKTS